MTPWKVLLLSLATSSTHTISPSPTVMSLNTCTNRRSHDFTCKCPVSFCAAAETSTCDCGQQRFPCLGGSSVSVPARTLLLVAVKTLRLCTSSFLNGPRAFSHASSTNLCSHRPHSSPTSPPQCDSTVSSETFHHRSSARAQNILLPPQSCRSWRRCWGSSSWTPPLCCPWHVYSEMRTLPVSTGGEIKWDKSRVGWEKVGGFISSSCCRAPTWHFFLWMWISPASERVQTAHVTT